MPRRPRSAAERQAELEQRALIWHRCTTELERVRQQLRAAGSNPAAIAHAAREGAGVLAAWSVAIEGDQPGALARAARQLARSAELPAHTSTPRKTLSRASGLALSMLAAAKPDTSVSWMIVARGRERPASGEDLDAEAQAANHAREALPPPAVDPGRQVAGETEDVRRALGPLQRRRGRWR